MKSGSEKITDQMRFMLTSEPRSMLYATRSGDIDETGRTICFSFSSEAPVERQFGMEILSHQAGAVRCERINNAGAFLVNHDVNDQVGAVVECGVVDGRGKAIVKFSRSARAQEIFDDIKDGIRPNISVRYQVHDFARKPSADARGGPDTFEVTDWEILEISTVSIPADYTVGVGRSLLTHKPTKEGDVMTIESQQGADAAAKRAAPSSNIESAESATAEATARKGASIEVISAERDRVKEIMDLSRSYGRQELAERFVADGASVDDFRKELLRTLSGGSKPVKTIDTGIGLSSREARSFSFAKAILAQVTGQWKNAEFERDVVDATRQRYRKESDNTLYIPMDVLQRSPLKASSMGAGQEFVPTDLDSDSFIAILRDRLVMQRLGAKVLSNLSGDLAIPKQSGSATSYWVDEGENVPVSNASTEKISLSPKTLSCHSDYTKKLLIQSSIDVENFVKQDMAASLALAMDRAAISGNGKTIKGIIATTKNVIAIGDGASISHSNIVAMETAVAEANAEIGAMSYVTGASMRGKLKTALVAPGTAQFLWTSSGIEGDGMMNGYRAVCSNIIPSAKNKATILFGSWNQVLIGMWGPLAVTVDPYTQAATNTIRIVSTHEVDVAVRYEQAFSVIKDASLV